LDKGHVILYLKGLICDSVYLTSRMGQVRCASFSDSNTGLTSPAFPAFQQPITTLRPTVLTQHYSTPSAFTLLSQQPCSLRNAKDGICAMGSAFDSLWGCSEASASGAQVGVRSIFLQWLSTLVLGLAEPQVLGDPSQVAF